MLLRMEFPLPGVNSVLEAFLRALVDFFRKELVSVLLYGSLVFDDLAPGYGDLDGR
ncbi:MAG: hypothetical protein K6U03_09190 [Firmicutes bacterium]|nr:hypothetical protein [Bacillota bacterium]